MLSFKQYKQQKQLTESVEINPIKDLEEVILNAHPEVEKLHLYPSGKHDIKLDTLIVKKEHRKQGVGSKVLHDLKTYADKHGKRIILTANVRDSAWGTTSQSRLDKFYKRNGFVANKGRNKDYAITATHYYAGKGHISESVDHPMIEVDGEMKHRHNSLGQPIHPTDEGIRNFHRWFGDSHVVDDHGRPIVLYHGTNQDFDAFDFSKARESGHVWASNDPKVASNFAIYRTVWNDANVMPVYINAKRIKSIDAGYRNIRDVDSVIHDAKRDMDYDAFVVKNARDSVNPYDTDPIADVWAIKDTSNIKSAIGNTGAFAHPSNITEAIEHPMIEVDGVMKHRNNSEGQPIHPTDEGIRNFHRWFGDSHVVDEHGRPLVVYHGTANDVESFDPDRAMSEGAAFYFSHSPLMKNKAENANMYAKSRGPKSGANIIPVYLKVHDMHEAGFAEKMPTEDAEIGNWLDKMDRFNRKLDYSKVDYYRSEIRKAKKNNKSGVVFRNMEDVPDNVSKRFNDNADIYAVFHSSQIKSATGNNGEFAHPTKITESEDYMGSHTAPTEKDAPAHDLTKVMPEDVYSSKASRYYSTGFSDSEDRNVFAKLHSIRNNPAARLTIYRAIPKSETRDSAITKLERHKAGILKTGRFPAGVDTSKFKNPSEYYDWAYDEVNRLKELPAEENIKKTINKGDWVTLSRAYAKEHGDAHLGGQYRILSKSVRADEVFTNGDSIHEWGYHPIEK